MENIFNLSPKGRIHLENRIFRKVRSYMKKVYKFDSLRKIDARCASIMVGENSLYYHVEGMIFDEDYSVYDDAGVLESSIVENILTPREKKVYYVPERPQDFSVGTMLIE